MITLQEQIAEAQREFALRRQVYAKLIKAGKLDEGQAKWQILCQAEIVKTLMRLDAEQRQMSLCGAGVSGVRRQQCRARMRTLCQAHSPSPDTMRSTPLRRKDLSSARRIAPASTVHIGAHAHFV